MHIHNAYECLPILQKYVCGSIGAILAERSKSTMTFVVTISITSLG